MTADELYKLQEQIEQLYNLDLINYDVYSEVIGAINNEFSKLLQESL